MQTIVRLERDHFCTHHAQSFVAGCAAVELRHFWPEAFSAATVAYELLEYFDVNAFVLEVKPAEDNFAAEIIFITAAKE